MIRPRISRSRRVLTSALVSAIGATGAVALSAPAAQAAAATPQANFDLVESAGRGLVTLNVLSNDRVDPSLTATVTSVDLVSSGWRPGEARFECPAFEPTVDFTPGGGVSVDFGSFDCDSHPSEPRLAELSYTLLDSAGQTSTARVSITEFRATTPFAATDDALTWNAGPFEITPGKRVPGTSVGAALSVFTNDFFGRESDYVAEVVQQPAAGKVISGQSPSTLSGLAVEIDPPAEWVSSAALGGGMWKHQGPLVQESFSYRLRLKTNAAVVTEPATVVFAYRATVRTASPTPPTQVTPVVTGPVETATVGNAFPVAVDVPGADRSSFNVAWSSTASACTPVSGWAAASAQNVRHIDFTCTRIPTAGVAPITATVTDTTTGISSTVSVDVPVGLKADVTAPDRIVDGVAGEVRAVNPTTQPIVSIDWTTSQPGTCKVRTGPNGASHTASQLLRCNGYTGPVDVTATVTPLVDGVEGTPISATKTAIVDPAAPTRVTVTDVAIGVPTRMITASVTTTAGIRVSGQIFLLDRLTPAGWVKVQQNNDGRFAVRAIQSAYRVRTLGGGGYAPSTSRTVSLRTQTSIRVGVSRRWTAVMVCVKAVGDRHLCTHPAKVTILKQAQNGNWVRVKKAVSRCSSGESACVIRVPGPGRYRVTFAGTTALTPSTSGVITLR